MHGPTCIFWVNLTLFSLQPKYAMLAVQIRAGMGLKLYLSTFQLALALIPGAGRARVLSTAGHVNADRD